MSRGVRKRGVRVTGPAAQMTCGAAAARYIRGRQLALSPIRRDDPEFVLLFIV